MVEEVAGAGYLVTEGVYGLKAAIKISPILEDDEGFLAIGTSDFLILKLQLYVKNCKKIYSRMSTRVDFRKRTY
jgi:hypothetical protein